MGRLRGVLRFTRHRFVDGATSALAPHPSCGFLPGSRLSPYQFASICDRHFSMARDRCDHAFFPTQLAASSSLHLFPLRHIFLCGKRETALAAEAGGCVKPGDDLHHDSAGNSLRHLLYPGGIEWTYMEPCFSWQMMLARPVAHTFFYVTDPNTGREFQVRPGKYLDLQQATHMGWRPDMVRQFACFLANKMPRLGPEPLRVQVRMYVSVNGRRPRIFLDPNVNLAAEPRSWGRPRWLLQIHDPLPPSGQDFSGEPFGTTPPGID